MNYLFRPLSTLYVDGTCGDLESGTRCFYARWFRQCFFKSIAPRTKQRLEINRTYNEASDLRSSIVLSVLGDLLLAQTLQLMAHAELTQKVATSKLWDPEERHERHEAEGCDTP